MKAKTNFKVMTKPELTDEEIQSHMDFNKLLQTYNQGSLTNKPTKWMVTSGAVLAITAIVSTVVYFYAHNPATERTGSQTQLAAAVDTTTTIAQENKPLQAPAKKIEEKIETFTSKKSTTISQKNQPNDSIEKKHAKPQFTEATPMDGYPSLYNYFDKELKYPVAPKDSLQGIVTVSFAITKAGKPDLIKIENSLGEAFDAECVRVIQNMPPWKPATMYGKPVQTRLSIPLTFKIKK